MSTPSETCAAAPPLTLLDLLTCQHARRAIPVPPWVTARLRGLDLWAHLDAPERAYHVCGKTGPCLVLLLTRRDGADDDGVAVGLTDWRLAADPEAHAALGIVVQDETRAQPVRRRP